MGKKNKRQKEGGKRSATPTEGKELSKQQKKQLMELVTQLLQTCMVMPDGPKEYEYYVELHSIVEKIRTVQEGLSCPSLDREKAIPEFLEWLKKHNVDTSAVEITSFPDCGYGLQATKDLNESDPFLTIPRKVMMTTGTAKESLLGPLIEEDKILQAMPSVVLALHVLCERRQADSFWKPYINVLPNEYTTPLYFLPEDLLHLKGSPAQSDCIKQFRNIARQYACFYRVFQTSQNADKLPIKDCFTFDDYRWAVSTVMTRQNQIPTPDGGKITFALIPMWDMCNHCNGTITTDYNLDKDCSECFALRNFKAKEQVFIFYGARSNAELLIHNGFVYPENELDRVAVRLGISKGDPLYEQKNELLKKLGLAVLRNFYIHSGMIPVDPQLMAFLRVFCMSEENLKELNSKELTEEDAEKIGDIDVPVSAENEEKVWAFLETRTALLLRAYDTASEEDEELLQKKEMNIHERLAVQLRMCEKRILKAAQVYAGDRKKSVKGDNSDTAAA
ncbi:actin-histidine N-methyltransferase-like [Saccostrea cucullata]|uniref:actin-histidine N-methyltransferase-like n=1 Tax=Saccostrea cuccullata TaxID=36930 RepID=UPI002ED036E9